VNDWSQVTSMQREVLKTVAVKTYPLLL
jgi:hypothetical protein